ncbi:NTF2 fold immunity protein of polymorphic toxin system component [Mucilaginibacter yixingensis]|uniref:NTF2 fold immunity protein of polymorphic toxin system component n=2 Tax=Mucilaginibacter yixingensis TaxID=1295612 RepID=A0A2T5JAP7_9SPHI|nr:NTF2 fold immunity protein of polymorphic toxin system component [Mucilaginibacter yixingensis]
MHSPRNNLGKQPLPDVKTAVTVAEAYLFKIYGKERIEGERPYLVFKYKGYWFVTGSLTSGAKGGVFDMILNPKDGKVITCTHGK